MWLSGGVNYGTYPSERIVGVAMPIFEVQKYNARLFFSNISLKGSYYIAILAYKRQYYTGFNIVFLVGSDTIVCGV